MGTGARCRERLARLVDPVRSSGPYDNVYRRRRRQVHASADGGETWTCLSTEMRFPEIMMRPGANPAKRILMMGASPFDQEILYGAIEVGG